jgi:hypothetical protein
VIFRLGTGKSVTFFTVYSIYLRSGRDRIFLYILTPYKSLEPCLKINNFFVCTINFAKVIYVFNVLFVYKFIYKTAKSSWLLDFFMYIN